MRSLLATGIPILAVRFPAARGGGPLTLRTDFHPEYDWQLGMLRKYRDEELFAPPRGTPEPPTKDQLVVKS